MRGRRGTHRKTVLLYIIAIMSGRRGTHCKTVLLYIIAIMSNKFFKQGDIPNTFSLEILPVNFLCYIYF